MHENIVANQKTILDLDQNPAHNLGRLESLVGLSLSTNMTLINSFQVICTDLVNIRNAYEMFLNIIFGVTKQF